MIDFESAWRGVVLAWSLMSAAGASLTFIMLRAALADQASLEKKSNPELSVLARRVVRGMTSRMVAVVAFLVASGTLWVLPEPAKELSVLAVRMGFALAFAVSALILLVLSVRDLMDTLDLLRDKPLPPRQATIPHV